MDFEMKIYILRHGASIANERMLVCGDSDYQLSENGLKQAAIISTHLREIEFDYVYSSPLSRARNTVPFFRKNFEIKIREELKELNTGSVSHITLPELWKRDDRFRMPWRYPELRYPNGETFREMTVRISDWFKTEQKTWKTGEKILIVGHEGTLRSIYSYLFNLNIFDYPDFLIGNCDYFIFNLNDDVVEDFKHMVLKDIIGV
jgi:broad specificity phosphatase PhoE